ncbi:hypothetical protein F3J44_28895 [Pantoea sp. Tr-811]|uniref:hypothetical protein n=1 Tax=Pantoea sp. Tr-811 TaxID=2608361 RepID=UPI001420225D|nr:hypothetical protein [Pantoea sp. Tr-811]NIF30357.1 hypothetical protein [Pantoea sp. Tr-811]
MNVCSTVPFVSQQLIYLLYGERRIYQLEAKLSILTALARSAPGEVPSIRVLTDVPQAFEGWPVEVVELDAGLLDAWTGNGGYLHRRKACAIAHAAAWAQKTIFIDTDTVFLQAPQKLFHQVDGGQFLVDEIEMSWAEASGSSYYAGFTQGLARAGEAPADDLQLCNSGVLGFALENAAVADRAVQRIDAWAPYTAALHTIEQIAFSFELHGARINQARGLISHYYAMKPFIHAILEIFFTRHGDRFDPSLLPLALQVPVQRPQPSWLDRLSAKWSLTRVPPHLRGIGRKLLYGSFIGNDEYQRACKVIWWRSAIDDMRRLGGFDWSNGWPQGLPRLRERDEQAITALARKDLEAS